MSDPAPSFTARVIAATLGICVVAGGAEIYARTLADSGLEFSVEMWRYAREVKRVADDPRVGHEHRPHAQSYLMGVPVRTNAWGDRNHEIPIAKAPGVFRILMLGDSLMFGWGVAEEDIVSRRLETLLTARYPGRRIEVINTGVGNYNTDMAVGAYLARTSKFDPDLVVLNYFINDAEPTPSYATTWLERNSQAFVYFASKIDAALRQTGGESDWRAYYRGLYEPGNATALAAAGRAIGELAAAARAKNTPVVVANYPELRELRPYPFESATAWVAGIARSNGMPFVDLLPAVANEVPETLWVTRPDPHPNAKADRLFAEALDRFLAESVLDARLGR
jgi:lysophospholipase L1-like esterase